MSSTALDLFYRTEDIALDDIQGFFVETRADRRLVDACKGRASVVLQGSRGVGKSFILRVAQAEMNDAFDADGVLPVYVTFNKAGLLQTADPLQFQRWMMAKLCSRIMRAVRQRGLVAQETSILPALAPNRGSESAVQAALLEIERRFEDSWKHPGKQVDGSESLDPQLLKDAIEDLCAATKLRRVVLLVDEAAHVFIPDQQRHFFTLMRDLRSPYISVKAAVYPGVTSFGDSFQMSHDATLLSVERDILDDGFMAAMREIVLKQDPELAGPISRYGEVFDALSFASTGNPRILLKTLARATPLNTQNAQRSIREYYRESIWAEHSALADRYTGHASLIDWGRELIEAHVIGELHDRNTRADGDASIALWIHRDAPTAVKEALRLLCYSGILQEAGSGLRATRSGTGSRYIVNVGCSVVQDADPVRYATRLRRQASIKRMIEFGPNHPRYQRIATLDLASLEGAQHVALDAQMQRSTDELDLSPFLRGKLGEMGFDTVGKVLAASEQDFRNAKWVGQIRARQMMNAATTAVLEYISG